MARALAIQDNLQSQISKSCLPFQMSWKPSLRDTYLIHGMWTFQPVKEPGEWGGRNLLPMFIRDTRANLTVPRWQHRTFSHRLCFSSPSHDAFGTKVSRSVCHSTDGCSLFCGLGRKLCGFLRLLQIWALCHHQEREWKSLLHRQLHGTEWSNNLWMHSRRGCIPLLCPRETMPLLWCTSTNIHDHTNSDITVT